MQEFIYTEQGGKTGKMQSVRACVGQAPSCTPTPTHLHGIQRRDDVLPTHLHGNLRRDDILPGAWAKPRLAPPHPPTSMAFCGVMTSSTPTPTHLHGILRRDDVLPLRVAHGELLALGVHIHTPCSKAVLRGRGGVGGWQGQQA